MLRRAAFVTAVAASFYAGAGALVLRYVIADWLRRANRHGRVFHTTRGS